MNRAPIQKSDISNQLRLMALMVVKAVNKAIHALKTRDALCAGEVVEEDKCINSCEIDLDNALYLFFAKMYGDIEAETIRFIPAGQKLNPLLERIGDHAVNIAESVQQLSLTKYTGSFYTIDDLADKCAALLHEAVNSFTDNNSSIAQEILRQDPLIDQQYEDIVQILKEALTATPPSISFDHCFLFVRICKDLERISDLSMNIAEETILVCQGQVVKHQDYAQQEG